MVFQIYHSVIKLCKLISLTKRPSEIKQTSYIYKYTKDWRINHIYIHLYLSIYRQYTYIVEIYNLFVRALETGKKRVFLSCFAASANEFDILRQCTYIVFILKCWKAQNNCQIVQRVETSVALVVFDDILNLWNPCLYCYRFWPLLNMNPVPDKLHLGQWLYIAKLYSVIAIWILKSNQCRKKINYYAVSGYHC